MKEKIKSIVFWILVAIIVFYFVRQLYWPLFATAEVAGGNFFNFAVITFIIWRAYRFRNPKKNTQSDSSIKLVEELESVRKENGYTTINDVARVNEKVSKDN